MAPPKASVAMSVYNGERYLRRSVESILHQTFSDFEFIIIDDGSTDSTATILHGYADPRIVRLHNPQPIGLSRSLNRCLTCVQGEFLARQDADDVSLSERLATQIAYLESHGHVGLVGTAYYVLDSQGQCIATHRQPLTDTEIRWQMLFHNAFCHTSVMFRREALDGDGLFYDEDLLYSQDYALFTRLLRRTCAANLETPFVAFRVHDGSTSATRHTEQEHIASTIAAQQINTLVPERLLTQSEIETLRHWYYRLPERLTKQDMALCRVVLEILSAFEKQQNIDSHIVRSLRRHWIDRILSTIGPQETGDLWASGFLSSVFHVDALCVVTYLPRRSMRWVERIFQARWRV